MAAPYPLLIKKQKIDGTSTAVINTETTFGMVCSKVPFHFTGDAKDLPSNDWFDEDGLEEYLPDEGIRLKSYEMSVEFLYKGLYNSFSSNLRAFIDFLAGKDGYGSILMIYDTFNNVGRQNVRFSGIDPDVLVKQSVANGSGQEVARFTVKFKVDDPDTDITLTA